MRTATRRCVPQEEFEANGGPAEEGRFNSQRSSSFVKKFKLGQGLRPGLLPQRWNVCQTALPLQAQEAVAIRPAAKFSTSDPKLQLA